MISYPISLPSSPAPRVLSPTGQNVTNITASPFTGEQQVQRTPAELLTFECDLPPMTADQGEDYIGTLLGLSGSYGEFYLGDTARKTPRGTATGTPVTGGDNSGIYNKAGQRSLYTSGWTASIAQILKRGDWLQLGAGYDSTRISTSGGSNVLKYLFTIATPASGASYRVAVRVRNMAAVAMKVTTNLGGSSLTVPAASETMASFLVVGDGVTQLQLRFESSSVGDSLDFYAWDPRSWRDGVEENLIPAANMAFVGWTAFGSAVVTLTQGHAQRIYKVTSDAASDASGNALVDIFPSLRESYLAGEPITLLNPAGVFRLSDDAIAWSIDQAITYGLKFTAMEAI
jgi:hypothetical protein